MKKELFYGLCAATTFHAGLQAEEIREWISSSGGDWNDVANWKDELLADGPGVSADLTASVGQNVKITVGSPARTIGYLYVGDGGGTPKGFTLSEMNDDPLTFDNNGANSLLKLGRPNGTNTKSLGGAIVTVDLQLKNSLDLDNISTFDGGVNINGALILQGDISAIVSGTMAITNIAIGERGVRISGAINDGNGVVQVVQNSPSGPLTLAGGNNYSGGTLVSDGILVIGGKGNLGVGPTRVGAGAVLRLAADRPFTEDSELILDDGAAVEVEGNVTLGRLSLDGGKSYVAPGQIGAAQSKSIKGSGLLKVVR